MEGFILFQTLTERCKGQLYQLLQEVLSKKGAIENYAAIVGDRKFTDLPSFFEAQSPHPGIVACIRYCPLKSEGYPISLEEPKDKEMFPLGAFAIQFKPQDISYNMFELIDVRIVVEYAKGKLDMEREELKKRSEELETKRGELEKILTL